MGTETSEAGSILAELLARLDAIKGPDPRFWDDLGRNEQTLGDLCRDALMDALLTGDGSAARQIGAEYWRRLGHSKQEAQVLGISDEQVAAAEDLAAMLPYIALLEERGMGDELCTEMMAVVEPTFHLIWDRNAGERRNEIRHWARVIETERLRWDLDDHPLDHTYDRFEAALQAVRAQITETGLTGPVEAVVWVSKSEFTRFAIERGRRSRKLPVETHLDAGYWPRSTPSRRAFPASRCVCSSAVSWSVSPWERPATRLWPPWGTLPPSRASARTRKS